MSDTGTGWFGRKRATVSRSADKPKSRPRRIGIMALEPRMMYDAAAVATAGAAAQQHQDAAPDAAHVAAVAEKMAAAVTSNTGAQTPSMAGASRTLEQSPNVQTPAPSNVSVAPQNDGHGQGDGAEPMPHLVTAVTNPTEIVFIDPQAPDHQLLAGGARPGVEVVVLDANSDGLQQIANFLRAHPDPNLTTIDIVAHGSDGMLFLGNTVLSNETVGQYAAQLQTIGAALWPGGDLMLYGCDLGEHAEGLILMQRIVDATGADVAGSTGPVGDAAQGGSWSLNITAGAITSAAPFTAETLSQYHDLLNAQLFVLTENGQGTQKGIDYGTDANGSTAGAATGVTLVPSSAFLANGNPDRIQLDVADGLYFILQQSDGFSPPHGNTISVGRLADVLAGTPTIQTLYSIGGGALINGLQVDAAENLIFFNQINPTGGGHYNDQFGVLNFTGAHFSGTATANLHTIESRGMSGMTVDAVNRAAYFYESSTSTNAVGPLGGLSTGTHNQQHFVNTVSKDQLYKVTWTGSNTNPSGFVLAALPIAIGGRPTYLGANNLPTSLGSFVDLQLDTTNHILYFDTNNVDPVTSTNHSGIYSYALTGNPTGVVNTVWTQNVAGSLSHFIIDPQTGKYYVSINTVTR